MWELLVCFFIIPFKQLLTTIGEQFDVGSEICGVSVSVKKNTCTFMVWNKTATFEQAINKIEYVKLDSCCNVKNEIENDMACSCSIAFPL